MGTREKWDFRTWRKTNPCLLDKFTVLCVEWVREPKTSYSQIWVNGAHATNFSGTEHVGGKHFMTIGNITDGGAIPFQEEIATLVLYVGIISGVPYALKKAIATQLCLEYGIKPDE